MVSAFVTDGAKNRNEAKAACQALMARRLRSGPSILKYKIFGVGKINPGQSVNGVEVSAIVEAGLLDECFVLGILGRFRTGKQSEHSGVAQSVDIDEDMRGASLREALDELQVTKRARGSPPIKRAPCHRQNHNR